MSRLDLSELQHGLPAITPAFGAALAEAAAVCLNDQQHQPGTELEVVGALTGCFELYWPPVTEQMHRCWNDREYATEQVAYGLALLLISKLTDYTVVERSRKGTDFDYWLGKPNDEPALPFQRAVRLEVSGIRRGTASQIRTRVKLKTRQVTLNAMTTPEFIAIIEFSHPLACIATP